MAAVDRITGTAVVLEFLKTGDTAGVDEKVLSGDFTEFSYNRQTDTVDVTAGNESEEYVKATIERLDFNCTIFDADQAYLSDILPQQTGKLSVYKEGKGSGLDVFSFNCVLTSFNHSMPFNGAVEIELAGKRVGNMVDEIGSTQA